MTKIYIQKFTKKVAIFICEKKYTFFQVKIKLNEIKFNKMFH